MSSVAASSIANGSDFLDLAQELSDEELLIQENVRTYVRNELLPRVPEWYERGTLDPAIARDLGSLGLLGMHLRGYGCAGASAIAYGLACMELEAGDSGLRSMVSVQGSLAMFAIWRYGSDEQKHEWLPRLASGEAIGCFGLTEPDAGSDPGAMRTTARRLDGGWSLSGTKMWITNGSVADVAVVWARSDDGIRGFLVSSDTPGFSTQEIHGKLSLRASITSELILDECRVPNGALLPQAEGLSAPLSCLNEARYGIVWGSMGAARSCYEAALDYAQTREAFGKPISHFQLTQAKLARMVVELSRGQLLALRLGRLKDERRIRPDQISLGKLANVAAALDVAREARTVLGANGITLEYPAMRHANNLETVATYEGTAEIHTLAVGAAVTGSPAYR